VEEYFPGETLAVFGQRGYSQRIAGALLRIHRRPSVVALDREGAVPLPFRQQDLADALGLSLGHTNKTLERSREIGLAQWSYGKIRIPDRAALVACVG
jgi:CRP/FNR family transcriptional regulator